MRLSEREFILDRLSAHNRIVPKKIPTSVLVDYLSLFSASGFQLGYFKSFFLSRELTHLDKSR
ncbi:MAG TPA: hypothetical protein VIK62_07120, partial [Verrucomicrobiae bacterium]